MTLIEYVDKKCATDGCKPGTVLRMIAEKAGMSYQALRGYYRGMKVGTATSAVRISVAINRMGGGKVKPATLMGLDSRAE